MRIRHSRDFPGDVAELAHRSQRLLLFAGQSSTQKEAKRTDEEKAEFPRHQARLRALGQVLARGEEVKHADRGNDETGDLKKTGKLTHAEKNSAESLPDPEVLRKPAGRASSCP